MDDAAAVRDLRDQLTPFHDRPAWAGTGILMLGPVSGIPPQVSRALTTLSEDVGDALAHG
jgi:hypothetical protein